jgi:phage terminase large subunit-like protein
MGAHVNLDALTHKEKLELLQLFQLKDRLFKENWLDRYKPYAKQLSFHTAGGVDLIRERLLMAANQVGKTLSAGMETAYHLTGRYPDWWDGARFDSETAGWAGSVTSQGTRDTVQRLLLGLPGDWGTGTIPKKYLVDIKRAAHGVPDSVESIMVRHVDGGTSRIGLKTYDQGRERWQGETLDFVWFDEEPPEDIYFEGLTRTNATGGIVYVTFTPLLGMSNVVKRFRMDKAPGTHITHMTIDDAEHYTQAERDAIIASYPEHEREARSMGIPVLGSGRIFTTPESVMRENPVHIPAFWRRIAGMDFGSDHPTAAVWLAHDMDTDVVHIYDTYRQKGGNPMTHAGAIKARGAWIPVAWPHDGDNETAAGPALQGQYRRQGVSMLPARATNPPDPKLKQKEGEGGNAVQPGLDEMDARMSTGRLKVARHLDDWWEEYRLYHRKDGKIVKLDDDLMSATRYAIMMLRHAKVQKVAQGPTIEAFVPHNSTYGY